MPRTRTPLTIVTLAALALAAQAPAASAKKAKPKADSLKGEVVEISCYLVDRTRIGPDHAECARDGITKGHPAGILTADGKLYLALGRDFKTANELLAPYAAKRVRVTGRKTKRAQMLGFIVEHVEELPPSPPAKKKGSRKN